MKVIIANINSKNKYYDFYSGLNQYSSVKEEYFCKETLKYAKEKKYTDITAVPVYTFDELASELENENDYCIVFTNFPNDESFKRFKVEQKHGSAYTTASTYNLSISKFKEILEKYKKCEIHIISGISDYFKPDKIIDDFRVLNENIYFIKKSEFLKQDYEQSYLNYIKSVISEQYGRNPYYNLSEKF
jgi:hypothetical protein